MAEAPYITPLLHPLLLICRDPRSSKWHGPRALRLGCPEMSWTRQAVGADAGGEAHRLLPLSHPPLLARQALGPSVVP